MAHLFAIYPEGQLTYPTFGKGKSSNHLQNCLCRGYVKFMECIYSSLKLRMTKKTCQRGGWNEMIRFTSGIEQALEVWHKETIWALGVAFGPFPTEFLTACYC